MNAHERLTSESFLEYAFLRWVLSPTVAPGFYELVTPQREVEVAGRRYRVDYEIAGSEKTVAVELDGFAFHGDRGAFSHDRMRQNDLQATGRMVLRFSYDSIRAETERCVGQLAVVLRGDPLLAGFVVDDPLVELPDMEPDPLYAASESPAGDERRSVGSYFDSVRYGLDKRTLRECQTQAVEALANYYARGGKTAACVMSVGSGKTTLGVAATLAFARRRALVVTPGSVVRGVFDRAFDPFAPGNVLYGLPGGPLIPGRPAPKVLILDRDEGPIRGVGREELLSADVIVTNFHSLGDVSSPDHLLAKLHPDDVDMIVVDEAHIAAADSYKRTFTHFAGARRLLMSACFRRLDGRPIESDVVYRYLLWDSIGDGNAKGLRVTRFAPDASQTTYEMVWSGGRREEIVGRDALLETIKDERKLAGITAKSEEPIRQVMREVRRALDEQAELLHPVKPRALFAALGEKHAEQLARLANDAGIPTDHLHHSMADSRIRSVRKRFEADSGDLQGLVQLRMLGQGYDFPPVAVVVPFRPYGSFGEFYQFVGRGIRIVNHPALAGRVGPGEQSLDLVYHAELGLDEHVRTIYEENEMDPPTINELVGQESAAVRKGPEAPGEQGPGGDRSAGDDRVRVERPETFVLFEHGAFERRVLHDVERVEQRRLERETEALAQAYAVYAASTQNPIAFDDYVEVVRGMHG